MQGKRRKSLLNTNISTEIGSFTNKILKFYHISESNLHMQGKRIKG